ncbi:MAG TPA: SRPBCC family protein [Anaerolineales bacterium]|nr:SRPBCC family protein [Anaerolineales bacterium]
MEFKSSIIINRPLPDVFAAVADFENWPKWEGSFLEVRRQSSGANMLEAVYWCKRKSPSVAESRFVVSEYEPDKKLGIEGDWVGFLKPVASFYFEPVPEGTRVTCVGRPQLRGLFRLLTPMMPTMGRRLNEKYLGNLKRLAESQ